MELKSVYIGMISYILKKSQIAFSDISNFSLKSAFLCFFFMMLSSISYFHAYQEVQMA